MPVHLATAKKVVPNHASDKQEKYGGQEHNKQELRNSKPRGILFFPIRLVAIRRHALFSRRAKGLTLDCDLYDPPFAPHRQTTSKLADSWEVKTVGIVRRFRSAWPPETGDAPGLKIEQ
jgi:hypothetical protein